MLIKDKKILKKLEFIEEKIELLEDKLKPVPEKFPIRLSDIEKKKIIELLKESNIYLEFGSGGSTFLAEFYSKTKNIISVESDFNWINYIKQWNILHNTQIVYIDIGKTGDWGYPVDSENKEN